MRNIRIGNDIKVQFTIDDSKDFNKMNIKQIRVYFVNQTLDNTQPPIKRFPLEPFPQFYEPTKYTLHGCGRFEYNVNPCYNKCEYYMGAPGFNDAHLWPYYNGFGVKPDHFVDCCNCPCCGPDNCPKKDPNIFLAPSIIEEKEGHVAAYFPAHEQIIAGEYKMVVVLTLYETGWGTQNLHTYTIDYGTLFNLVTDETGESGDVIIDINPKEAPEAPIITITTEGKVTISGEGTIYYTTDGSTPTSDSKVYVGSFTVTDGTTIKAIAMNDGLTSETSTATYTAPKVYGGYIGFYNAETVDDLDITQLTKVDNIIGTHQFQNTTGDYAYMWVISDIPVKVVAGGITLVLEQLESSKYNYVLRTYQKQGVVPRTYEIQAL